MPVGIPDMGMVTTGLALAPHTQSNITARCCGNVKEEVLLYRMQMLSHLSQ